MFVGDIITFKDSILRRSLIVKNILKHLQKSFTEFIQVKTLVFDEYGFLPTSKLRGLKVSSTKNLILKNTHTKMLQINFSGLDSVVISLGK